MRPVDHAKFEEWLDPDLGEDLPLAEREALEAHLVECAACRDERAGLARLDGVLEAGRIAVRPSFRDQVLQALPVAGWEGRARRAWRLPLAVLALLVVAAVIVVDFGSVGVHFHASLLAALAAVGDFVATAVLAGAGLLGATWKGVGLVLEGTLSRSAGNLAAFAVLVVSLDLFLVALLRRKPKVASSSRGRRGGAEKP